MEKKTAEEILSEKTGLTINDEYAYRIQTKTEYILKAMVTYASQESEPLKDKIKELEGEYTELRRKLHKESDRLFTVSFIRDLDQKVSKGGTSIIKMSWW